MNSLDLTARRSITAGWTPTFWTLQLTGWTAYFVLHYLGARTDGEPPVIVWSALANALAGFGLTSAMHPILMRLWRLPAPQAAGLALLVSLLFAVPFSAISEQVYWWTQGRGWRLALNDPLSYLGSAFWCGSILLTWVGIYFGVAYYSQAQEQRAAALKAEAAAKDARLGMLRQQLNPHFLFNTLNGISTLILEQRNAAAADMVDQLSALLRASLEGDTRERISLGEELALAEQYLAIERTRFGDRLKVEIDVDPLLRPLLVPRLILQPLVENAVRYAVAPSEAGAHIAIRAAFEPGRLRLSVIDSGRGGTDEAGHGLGLANVRERLRALYGQAHAFSAGAVHGGWRATIELPAERP